MTAMIDDSWSGAPETVAPRPRSVGAAAQHGGGAKHKVIPGMSRRAHRGVQCSRPAIELAEPLHRSDEPTVAVGYAVLCGVMAAQGRFGEARQWLGRAERILQPRAEWGIGMLPSRYTGLISEILDLLAQPGQPAAAPGSDAGIAGRMGEPREPLTEGETRVLRYLPTHLVAREIASELYLSENTVKTHLRHLYQKLGAHSRREAVEHARALGMLPSSIRLTSARVERGDRYDSDSR